MDSNVRDICAFSVLYKFRPINPLLLGEIGGGGGVNVILSHYYPFSKPLYTVVIAQSLNWYNW